jgi:putative transposase
MRGSLPRSRAMTSDAKSIISSKSIRTTKFLKILEADLTSTEKGSDGFWNNLSKAISTKLWCPQPTGSPGMEQTNYSCGYSPDSAENSLYLATQYRDRVMRNSQKTCWPLLLYSQPDTTAAENIVTRKIRFYPNREQAALFQKYFDAHRYFYNAALATWSVEKKSPNFISIRNEVVINDTKLTEATMWMKEVPYDTRQLAVKSFVGACKAAITLKKKGFQKNFEMKPLKKKERSAVFYVNKKALTKDFKVFTRRLRGRAALRFRTKMKRSLAHVKNDGDFPIIKDTSGRYYLCLVVRKKQQPLTSKVNMVALDPGVKTFQTYYDGVECGKFGDAFHKKIAPLLKRVDRLSGLQNLTAKKRYSVGCRMALLRTKITNKIRDLHWKTANYLANNYHVIMLPLFRSQQIAQQSNNKWLNRYMLQLSHYKFRERLMSKAKQTGSLVVLCKENWTSKTCGMCGFKKMDLGNASVYECDVCHAIIDRDINGSRNILIRSLTKYYEHSGKIRPVKVGNRRC